MDYGHDLRFGTFITPSNERPRDVVALAQLTEAAGLDLVTFQDHPYQPAYLDTWTLLSWVAASTERVTVAGNVLSLPLRPPAVLAKAAASLDLLSGGRFELGLGAGAFWDAIEAMGAERLTPGESVDALSEAIDVIRGLWDASERAPLRIAGEHHHVSGARRGPAPAHEIGIWIGAYKPRMLRLTGRKGDGWLPSLGYLDLADAPAANRTIDDAARTAGRDPREIRRMLNLLGNGLSVDELTALAVEQGFSTFILPGDDPAAIQRFGEETAPAVREAVAAARAAAGTPEAAVTSVWRRRKRRETIDYGAIPAGVDAVEPGDAEYDRVRSTYVRAGRPGLVLRPGTPEEVAEALAYARDQGVPLAVRSGGHGISGRSTNDGGIVIDLGRLNGIELLDRETGRVRLGPGARWAEVARELAPHDLGISSGDYGGVGVGGLVTAGGLGFLARKHGLTIDHVVAAEVVLADGRLVRADDDLLWALRGAGGNFGIVTAVELEAYPVGDVAFSVMAFDASDPAPLLERWGRAVEEAPRELTSFLGVFQGRRGEPPVAQAYSVYAGDDPDAAVAALTPLAAAGRLLGQQAHILPYPAVLPHQPGVHRGGSLTVSHSGLLERMTPEAAEAIGAAIGSGDVPFLQIRAAGGAVNDVDPMATAYAHRTQQFSVSGASPEWTRRRFDARWEQLRPHFRGLYLSFETDTGPDRLRDAFPGATLERLRRLKHRFDPDNVFDANFAIPPAVPSPA